MASRLSELIHLWVFGDTERGIESVMTIKQLAAYADADYTSARNWAYGYSEPSGPHQSVMFKALPAPRQHDFLRCLTDGTPWMHVLKGAPIFDLNGDGVEDIHDLLDIIPGVAVASGALQQTGREVTRDGDFCERDKVLFERVCHEVAEKAECCIALAGRLTQKRMARRRAKQPQ